LGRPVPDRPVRTGPAGTGRPRQAAGRVV